MHSHFAYDGKTLPKVSQNGYKVLSNNEFHALSSGMKAKISSIAAHATNVCRELCCGVWYKAINRMRNAKASADAAVSYEGANAVLRQLVVKHLLGTL